LMFNKVRLIACRLAGSERGCSLSWRALCLAMVFTKASQDEAALPCK
jgi:hypothetical protein